MNDKLLIITRYSHFFKVTHIKDRVKPLLHKFIKNFIQMGWVKDDYGKNHYLPVKVYGASTKLRDEYRFHISSFDSFIELLSNNNVHMDLVDIIDYPLYTPAPLNVKLKDGWKPFEEQVPMVEYFTNGIGNSKFLDLQTGKGKSFIATQSIINLNQRAVIILLPRFIEKWGLDLVKMTNLKPKQILTVQGNNQLQGLFKIAESENFDYPFTIISIKTLQAWIKNYELDPKGFIEYYGFPIEDMFYKLKAGIKLVDEIHMDFHLNFKLEMYTHIPLDMGLSATLISDDPFIEKMYNVMFPIDTRFNSNIRDKYVNSVALMYNHDFRAKVKTTEWGSNKYSHIAYEKWILKSNKHKLEYFKLIKYAIDSGYISDYKNPEKAVIFVSTKIMATELTKYLINEYPHLDVRRYIEEDDYSNLLDADIRVTTILSGGTGHDMSNLKLALLTISIKSIQSNLQALGRLRKLKDSPTRFYYLVDLNIKKHVEYHEHKKEMLLERTLTFRELFYPDILYKGY